MPKRVMPESLPKELQGLKQLNYYTRDEDGVELLVHSSNGKDKGMFVHHSLNSHRPLQITIESMLFDKYQFKIYDMTLSEARELSKVLSDMVKYIEDNKESVS